MPGWIGDAVSVVGWLSLAVFTFLIGQELAGWVPRQFGRAASTLFSTVAPAIVGTLLILVLYWPLPRFFIGSTIAGAVFWIPSTIGAMFGFKRPGPERRLAAFTWTDALVAMAAIATVRVFATGIRLAH
jgi:hypothetical protein